MNAILTDTSPGRRTPRPRLAKAFGFALLPLSIITVGVAGYYLLTHFRNKEESLRPPQQPPMVRVFKLTKDQPSFEIRIDGVVVPKVEITIAAEVIGRIIALGHDVELLSPEELLQTHTNAPVLKGAKSANIRPPLDKDASPKQTKILRAGNYVRKGDILLRIDPTVYQLEMLRLDAELAQTTVDLEQLVIERENQQGVDGKGGLKRIADKELELAQGDLKRLMPLYRQKRITESQKAESERQVEKAKHALATIENALRLIPKRRERLLAQQRLAGARLRKAQLDLEKTLIRAPISGVISLLAVDENDFVQQGSQLLKIVDPTVMEVKCKLRPEDLHWLWDSVERRPPGKETSGRPYFEIPHARADVIYTVAGEKYVWEGKSGGENVPFLSRYEDGRMDVRTRTVPCRVEVPKPQRDAADGPRTLIPDMFVEVVLYVQPKTALLKIPEEALQSGNRVFTIEDGDKLKGKLKVHENVNVVRVVNGYALIRRDRSDLKPEDRVIVSQLPNVYPGMTVRIEQAKPETNEKPQSSREET